MVMTWTARALTEDEHEAVLASPRRVAALVEDEPPDPQRGVDLDTAWHGIHWLLTGTAYDAETATGQAIFGGEPIGPDLGNGKAHLIDPRTVKRIAEALSHLKATDLAERVDPEAMREADIYPGYWDEVDIFQAWLRPRYKALRKFYRRAAGHGSAVLTAIL